MVMVIYIVDYNGCCVFKFTANYQLKECKQEEVLERLEPVQSDNFLRIYACN